MRTVNTIDPYEKRLLDVLALASGTGDAIAQEAAIEFLMKLAYADGDKAATEILDVAEGMTEPGVVVDGSMYSPSTRALPGAEVWFRMSGEVDGLLEAFTEAFDNATIYGSGPVADRLDWEDGCLFLMAEDDEDGPA